MTLRRCSKSPSLPREPSALVSLDGVCPNGSVFQLVQIAGMSDRLPSGKTARTRSTPRRRILLITASD
jgi:hypothetical protein